MAEAHDCTGCALSDASTRSRRDFLREAAAAAASALVTLGVLPAVAQAIPLAFAEPTGPRSAAGEKSYAIPSADGVFIDRDEDLILARWKGAVYAFALSCPHQNTALRWNAGDQQFQCPKHKSKYRPDGVFVSGRATRGMDRFAIRREGASVVVNLDVLLQEDEDREGWERAVLRV